MVPTKDKCFRAKQDADGQGSTCSTRGSMRAGPEAGGHQGKAIGSAAFWQEFRGAGRLENKREERQRRGHVRPHSVWEKGQWTRCSREPPIPETHWGVKGRERGSGGENSSWGC